MENNSDDEHAENTFSTNDNDDNDDETKSINNVKNQTGILHGREESFSSKLCSNAAESQSFSFQKSKEFKRQFIPPSGSGGGTCDSQRRGIGNSKPDSKHKHNSFQNQTSGSFKPDYSRQLSHFSQETDKNIQSPDKNEDGNVTINKLTDQVNEKGHGGSYYENFMNSKDPNEKLRMWRELKEKCNSMRSSISSEEILMEYRKEIETMSYECTKHNLKRVQSVLQNHEAHSDNLRLHLRSVADNLSLQQKHFDEFINRMKHECFILNDIADSNNIDDIIKEADKIKMLVENECTLFRKTLPAYAYKSDIINALRCNQVVIIPADCSYFFNTAAPVIVCSELPNSSIVSCESTNISCESVRYDVVNLMKHRSENISSIAFMNIEEMLNYLKHSKTSGKNCFILNLSLKRSVASDLLLVTLKETLTHQKHSKLILLLSAFDNIKYYHKYFSSLQVLLLEVPKLLLPVQTVWKKEPLVLKNYKEDVVCTALAIHILKPLRGDILAFLPSLADAEAVRAMLMQKIEQLNYDSLQCFLLHEDSSNISVFKQLSKHRKRKIFLTTHCMEVIPVLSVSYVIDCGLMSDYMYDSNKNLDVLNAVFNSRSRARLRKSLVGVYKPGICYRIFNKENFFNDMPTYELPDILILNPFNTFIKIFHHYPQKALTLKFVEPLTDVIKYNTVRQLKNFNAIKEKKLTKLGQKIAMLPFNARYSKLILQGIQWGFAYEAVILVAYFSNYSSVYNFTKDKKYQQPVDSCKLDLMQHDSDALSFLHIFKSWVANKCSIEWCNEFHIDFTVLKIAKEQISEICQIVHDSLNESISQTFSSVENAAASILEMLFQCFSDNLCVFSGHDRSGYRILSARQTAFIHPSSIIYSKENLPQLIIYDKVIKTSRYLLLGITTMPTDLVRNSLAEKLSEFDIFERTLVSETIEPVEERIIKRVLLGVDGEKLEEIESLIKEKVQSDYIVIDSRVEKGCVEVYALESVLKDAVKIVDELLKSNLNDVINAETIHTLELQMGEIVIPLEVKCVMGAIITSVQMKEKTKSSVSTKNSHKLLSEPVKDNTPSFKYSINLSWIRRRCSGVCYVNFTPDSFIEARKLTTQKIIILQSEVNVEFSSRNENELILTELPPETRAIDVEESLKRELQGVDIPKIELKFARPFETPHKDIAEIKMEIHENCENCEDLIDFHIIIPKPKASDTIMTAFVNVFGTEDLAASAEKLSNTMIRNFKVNATPVYRSVIRVNIEVFKALESRIEEGICKLKLDLSKLFPERKELFCFESDYISDSGWVVLSLHSNYMKCMKHLQKTVNELLEGEVLNKNQVKDIHKLFCHGGRIWLKNLEKPNEVFILQECNSKTIRIYGASENCLKVKECILNFLKDTENEIVESIVLTNDRTSRIVIKSLIKEHSVHLEKFVELCELRSAKLDIKTCSVLLHGSRNSIEKAKEILNCVSNELLHSSNEYSALCGGEICPVCDCPALNQTFRLQHCNHLYCRDCISSLVEQAQFPIQCCGENCSYDIVVDDIVKILDGDDEKMKKLLWSSLNEYLEKNTQEMFYCPAPDCPMFAYKSQVSGIWYCPLCQNKICGRCNIAYHYGFTCDEYQWSKTDPDYLFKIRCNKMHESATEIAEEAVEGSSSASGARGKVFQDVRSQTGKIEVKKIMDNFINRFRNFMKNRKS